MPPKANPSVIKFGVPRQVNATPHIFLSSPPSSEGVDARVSTVSYGWPSVPRGSYRRRSPGLTVDAHRRQPVFINLRRQISSDISFAGDLLTDVDSWSGRSGGRWVGRAVDGGQGCLSGTGRTAGGANPTGD